MNAPLDLFGQPDLAPPPLPAGTRHRTKPGGYARPPGTGPAGQTCGTCAHYVHVGGGTRHYNKCKIVQHRWTHGPGTDILKRSPACSFWQTHEP